MEKPFVCNSAITLEWEGFIYFHPKNDENNILAARFDADPRNPPLFPAGEELYGRLELDDVTLARQVDTAATSHVSQADDDIDEHNTEVTGTVVGVNPKWHEAQVKVEGFPVEITVHDKCVEGFDVGSHVMLVGDLIFYYE